MNKYIIIVKAIALIESGDRNYLCTAIEFASGQDDMKATDIIPELLEYKPEDKAVRFSWWSRNAQGKSERLRVLNELKNRFEGEQTEIKFK